MLYYNTTDNGLSLSSKASTAIYQPLSNIPGSINGYDAETTRAYPDGFTKVRSPSASPKSQVWSVAVPYNRENEDGEAITTNLRNTPFGENKQYVDPTPSTDQVKVFQSVVDTLNDLVTCEPEDKNPDLFSIINASIATRFPGVKIKEDGIGGVGDDDTAFRVVVEVDGVL